MRLKEQSRETKEEINHNSWLIDDVSLNILHNQNSKDTTFVQVFYYPYIRVI